MDHLVVMKVEGNITLTLERSHYLLDLNELGSPEPTLLWTDTKTWCTFHFNLRSQVPESHFFEVRFEFHFAKRRDIFEVQSF